MEISTNQKQIFTICHVNSEGFVKGVEKTNKGHKVIFSNNCNEVMHLQLRDKQHSDFKLSISLLHYLVNDYGIDNVNVFDVLAR